MNLYNAELTIGDVARRTGIGIPTLRVWEERYGFPSPERVPSGHRRYSEDDCRVLTAVARERQAGASVPEAIERARRQVAEPATSIYAALRDRLPSLQPMLLSKTAMLAVSRAIEDEAAARATAPVLVGAFQRERFWRATEPRWRDLARTAHATVVLADLPRRSHRGGVWEIPLADATPLVREWAIVCDSPTGGACLVGTERPGQGRRADRDRAFEAVWTVDPDVVREAARVAVAIASRAAPEVGARVGARLASRPVTSLDAVLQATTLTNRIVAYLERPIRRR
jgi:DICT domain-containing protein